MGIRLLRVKRKRPSPGKRLILGRGGGALSPRGGDSSGSAGPSNRTAELYPRAMWVPRLTAQRPPWPDAVTGLG